MSAILGIYRIDGGPVAPADLARMGQTLGHRGPDGQEQWSCGPIGLGHQRLCTTPESRHEILPLGLPDQSLMISADARLDNRAALQASLEITGDLDEIGDGELILRAYAQWGQSCVEKLLGDYAFAIWDAERQTLFCARDHFGVKPFFYHLVQGKSFIFATEIKALFALPGTPRELNGERIGDYLADVFGDGESTFYRNIRRLPSSHCLTISPRGTCLRRYWSLDPGRETRFANDEEYAEAFREIFIDAVRCRLRASGRVGSMLSGGLDSSSISCAAGNLLSAGGGPSLKTFSAVFETVTECDERPFINAVLDAKNLDPHFIEGNQHGPFSNLRRIQWHMDQPAYGPNCDMVWSIYESAKSNEVRVLLDGHDGDTTVSYGDRYLHELARAGKWFALTSELRGVAKHDDSSAWKSLRAFAWHYRIQPLINEHRGLRLVRDQWRRRVAGDTPKPSRWPGLLNTGLFKEINMEARYRAWRQTIAQTAPTERDAHFRMLSHPMQGFALELHDGSAAAFGIEKRYPFWDKRLVEFCLSLPSSQKLNRGWTRFVLRRAMEGILPPTVQWRNDKTDFGPSLAFGLRTFERAQLKDLIVRTQEIISEYVNLTELQGSLTRFLNDDAQRRSADLFNIWKAVSLAFWLQAECAGSRDSFTTENPERGWWSCKPKPEAQMGYARFQQTG